MTVGLKQLLAPVKGPLLIVEDGTQVIGQRLDALSLPPSATRWSVREDLPPAGVEAWATAALVVRDRQSLRRVVSALPQLGTSSRIWCWIEDCGGWAPAPTVRPEWPRVQKMTVHAAGPGWADLEFAVRAP